ncbi:MAG: hypothetical protein J6D29_01235 [Solobacterium sp.]|nr:hypothetical protein [Solobacterium sp.]
MKRLLQQIPYQLKNKGLLILSAFFFCLLSFSNYTLHNIITLIGVGYCLYLSFSSGEKPYTYSRGTQLFAILFCICMSSQFIIQFVNHAGLVSFASSIMNYKVAVILCIFVLVPLSYPFVHEAVVLIRSHTFGKWFLKWFDKLVQMENFNVLIIGLMIVSLVLRMISTLHTTSDDYLVFIDWISHYETYGYQGLGIALGDYYIPQNILLYLMSILPFDIRINISLFSWIAEYITIYYLYKLIRLYLVEDTETNHRKALLTSTLTLYLPMVFMNSSVWKQCDAIYVLFMIMSVYYFLLDKPGMSFAMMGISFSLKQQAIFLLPYYIIMYVVKRKKGFWYVIWLPIIFFLAGLPAVILGQSMQDVYLRFFNQAGMYSMLTFSYPNIYGFEFTHILNRYYGTLMKIALLLTTLSFVWIGLTSLAKKNRFDIPTQILFAGFVNFTCCMFLPAMHERYDYFTILLVVIILLTYDRSWMFPAFLFTIGTFVTYMSYLFHLMFALPPISLVYCYLYGLYFYKLFYEPKAERDLT